MTYMADRVSSFGTTIFSEMTALAIEHDAINLGQGFPDFSAPSFIKQAAIQAIQNDINQYAPSNGLLNLRAAIATKMQEFYDFEVDSSRELVVTSGATEALFAAIIGLVNPGEEVIVFEPFYDSYLPAVRVADGVPRTYTLRPPDWYIDPEALAALFSDKTKVIMINTPHNPTGKVYSQDELQLIADLCQKHDVIAITDEVYEHIIFDDCEHLHLAKLPGMADRTVTISSAGKTFSTTGWKVGWAIGQPELVTSIQRAHQFMTFCGAAPLQAGCVQALQAPRDYYDELSKMYQTNRDILAEGLDKAGLRPIMPQGTYFMMTDISHLGFEDDRAFCRYLTTEVGVTAIPPSAFFNDPADGATIARFAFCKSRETLEAAAERLMKLK